MGLKPLFAVLVVTALALAGCSGKDGDDEPEPTASASSSSATTATQPNRAPTASLNASVTNGTSPLNVTFAVGGDDLDDDALTWTLTFGDGNRTNGTTLPAQANHTYATTQNLTVQAVLTVSDGTANGTANVTISVTPPGSAAVPTQTIFEGEVASNCGTQEGCYTVGAEGCLSWLLHQQGIDCVWFEIAPELAGLPFITESGGDVDVDFRTDCELTGESVQVFGADGQEEGEVPAAGCAVLMDYVAGGLVRLLVG